jgi:hypothetical protein
LLIYYKFLKKNNGQKLMITLTKWFIVLIVSSIISFCGLLLGFYAGKLFMEFAFQLGGH